MRAFRILSAILCLASLGALAADLTAPVNTERRQLYNKGYRDVKDGTNAGTMDCVVANDYDQGGATNTVKTSGGYVEQIIFAGCMDPYYIGDSSFTWGNFAWHNPGFNLVIATVTYTTTTQPLVLPIKARFTNGLVVYHHASTCTTTVSYR